MTDDTIILMEDIDTLTDEDMEMYLDELDAVRNIEMELSKNNIELDEDRLNPDKNYKLIYR